MQKVIKDKTNDKNITEFIYLLHNT